MPTREDFLAEAKAKAMFARTPSLDEIADRAYEILLASVGRCLPLRCNSPPKGKITSD
jgi:hypothetical protein